MTHEPIPATSDTVDTPTRDPNGHNTATVSWDDIAAVGLWQSSRAACGCSEHRHADDHADEYSGNTGAPATLHDPGRCTRGRSDAELDPRLARHLGVAVPDGATTVSMTPEELAGALRGVPADQALAAVATERAAEAPFTAAGLEHIAAKRKLAADCDAALDAVLAGTLTMEDAEKMFAEIRQRHSIPDQPVQPVTPAAPFKVPPAPGVAPAPGGAPPIGNLGGGVGVMGVVPPAANRPVGPAPASVPFSESDADDAELAAALAALEADPTDVFAAKTAEWHQEKAELTLQLAPYLDRIPDPAVRDLEVKILMEMPLADRAELVTATLSGQLARLHLSVSQFDPTGKIARLSWIRLREGAAGKVSMSDMAEMTEAELDALLDAEPPTPVIGKGLFYSRGLHLLAGPGGCGKTWLALCACVDVVPALKIPGAVPGPVAVYLDLDQNLTLYQRLRDLGLSRDAMRRRDVIAMNVGAYAAERGEGTVACLRAIIDDLVEHPPKVVIVDSMARVMAESGLDSNSADDVTRTLNMFNALAERTCVIVIDHVGHAAPERPSGSAAKAHASRVTLAMKPVGTDAEAHPDTIVSGMVCATKDRDGGLKRHAAEGDRDPLPDLGLVVVDRDEATGRTEVKFLPQRGNVAAKERRQSDEGQAHAAEAKEAILAAVKAADDAAVTVEEARANGGVVKAPLSYKGIVTTVWPLFAERSGFTKSDFENVIKDLRKTKAIVQRFANYGNQGGGVRYRLPGPVG